MIRLLLKVSFGIFLCLVSHKSIAQVVFNAPFISPLLSGQNFDIPIRVKNFVNIDGMQFAVRWNPAVLQFNSVGSFNLPSLGTGNFNLDTVEIGVFRFNWYANPQTLPNLAHIFKINFKIIGATGTSSEILFTDDQTSTFFPIEVTQRLDSFSNAIPFTLEPGMIGVGYTIATDDFQKIDEKSNFSVFPNPCSTSFFVKTTPDFFSENCQIELQTAAGQTVFQSNNTRIPAGGIEIATDGLPKGIYFLIIRNSQFTDLKKLMLVD